MKARSRIATEQALRQYHLEQPEHKEDTRSLRNYPIILCALLIAAAVCCGGTWAVVNFGNIVANFRVRIPGCTVAANSCAVGGSNL
jgi:hypothetical protein